MKCESSHCLYQILLWVADCFLIPCRALRDTRVDFIYRQWIQGWHERTETLWTKCDFYSCISLCVSVVCTSCACCTGRGQESLRRQHCTCLSNSVKLHSPSFSHPLTLNVYPVKWKKHFTIYIIECNFQSGFVFDLLSIITVFLMSLIPTWVWRVALERLLNKTGNYVKCTISIGFKYHYKVQILFAFAPAPSEIMHVWTSKEKFNVDNMFIHPSKYAFCRNPSANWSIINM